MVKFFFVLGVQVEEGSLLESSNLNLIRNPMAGGVASGGQRMFLRDVRIRRS